MKPQQQLITLSQRIGLFTGPRIGDALISMVSAENLRRVGHSVIVYSDPMHGLSRWFPNMRIEPLPSVENRDEILSQLDVLLHTFDSDVLPEAVGHPGLIVLDRLPIYRAILAPQAEVHREICGLIFGVVESTIDNGMRCPLLNMRKDDQRIMIHPTANCPNKLWSPKSFIKVGRLLLDRGLSPEFVTSPSEIDSTKWIEDMGFNRFSVNDLDSVAERLASARAFIGNDSGIAHLASSVGLPVVAFYWRRKIAIRWKPGWSNTETLIPAVPLLIKQLKLRFWRNFITPKHVMSAFDRILPPLDSSCSS